MEKTKSGTSIWVLIAGVLMIILGGYVFTNPVATLAAITIYLGVILIIIGFCYISGYYLFKSGWHLALGIFNVLLGVIFIANLGISTATLPLMLSFWAMFKGIIQISTSMQFKELKIKNWWLLTLLGVVGVLFSILIICNPAVGVFTITFLTGAYFVVYGISEISEYFINKKG